MSVRLDVDPRYTADKVREAFSGVEELEVDVFQAAYGSYDFGVLSLFENVRGVQRCRVYGSVGDGRYAKWLERAVCRGVGERVEGFDHKGLDVVVSLDHEITPESEAVIGNG